MTDGHTDEGHSYNLSSASLWEINKTGAQNVRLFISDDTKITLKNVFSKP